MGIINWYAIAFAFVVALYVIVQLCIRTVRFFWTSLANHALLFARAVQHVRRYFLSYVYYQQIPRCFRGSKDVAWFDVLLLLTFLAVNALFLSLGVRDIDAFIQRSGLLCSINLLPLFLGGHMNILANYCGIGMQVYARLHRWLGRVAVLEGLLHAVVSISTQGSRFLAQPDIAAITASLILILVSLSGLLRRHWYEVFVASHFSLSIALIPLLYLHRPKPIHHASSIYLVVAVAMMLLVISTRFTHALYRNVRCKQPLSRAFTQTIFFQRSGRNIALSDAIHVHVRLPRPWKFEAGQYIYLCIPCLNFTSPVQTHPYYVAWQYRKDGSEYVVLVVEKKCGFSRKIFSFCNKLSMAPGLLAVIEGPFGTSESLGKYDTILLFATGIGITGQLSYIEQLLNEARKPDSKPNKVVLFWQVHSEVQLAWVADKVQDLLKEDRNITLNIHLFVLGNYMSPETRPGQYVKTGERIDILYGPMNVKSIVASENSNENGPMAILVCADQDTGAAIREAVRASDCKTFFKELDFRPSKHSGFSGAQNTAA